MGRRLPWIFAVFALPFPVSCSCSDPPTEDIADAGTTEASTEETGSTTTSTGGSDDGGSTETGDEVEDHERVRLLYFDRSPENIFRLFWVDYEGTPLGTPETVHPPLERGSTVTTPMIVSRDQRWLIYAISWGFDVGIDFYIVDLRDPDFPKPVLVNESVEAEFVFGLGFSPDSTKLVFMTSSESPGSTAARALFVADLDGEALEPVQLVSTMEIDGGLGLPMWSADGTRIAYRGDLEETGTYALWVQDADTVDPKEPVQVSLDGASQAWWTPGGETLVYAFDQDDDGVDEIFIVDASGAGDPDVHDPGADGEVHAIALAPDGRALTYWIGDPEAMYGERRLLPIDGDMFGAAGSVHTEARVIPGRTRWSPDSTRLLYVVDADGQRESWLVELDGTSPGRPLQVSHPFGPGEQAGSHYFDPTGSAVYYFTVATDGPPTTASALHYVSLGPGTAGAPIPLGSPETVFSQELVFSDDGAQALFTASEDSPWRLFWMDVSDNPPSAPVQLSPSTSPSVTFASRFSPSGSTVFYAAQDSAEPDALLAVRPDTPEQPTVVGGEDTVLSIRVFDLP
jgi:Tol biopolymer transport system component